MHEPQVDKNHYSFEKYCYPDRWASYYYQLRETFALKPQSILEIGAGDSVYKNYVMSNLDATYTSLDIAPDLKPDLIGSVTNIPIKDASVELAVAFEVLEHLPFDQFPLALAELHRVSKKNVLISIPHFGPPIKFLLKIPFLPEIKFAFKIQYPRKHVFNGEHYWEIGKKGYPPKRIRDEIKNHFKILKEFVPFENQYHHFFVLEKSY